MRFSRKSQSILLFCLACVAFTATFSIPDSGRASVGSFAKVGSLITRRFEPSATLLHDGRVAVFGGDPHDSFDPVPNIEIFDPADGKFKAAGEMAVPRSSSEAITLADGRVLVADGYGASEGNDYDGTRSRIVLGSSVGVSSSVDAIELFDPLQMTSAIVGTTEGLELGESIALLPNDRVLFIGRPITESHFVDGEIKKTFRPGWSQTFDLNTGEFLAPTPQIGVRDGGYVVSMDDGLVLLGGGSEWTGEVEKKLLSAEIFDPVSRSYTRTGDSVFTHESSSATKLPNGQILIAGGEDHESNGLTKTAELFDPTTGTFSRTGDMNVARAGHDAVLLGDGRVLVSGGDQPDFRSAEVYDYRTERFTRVGSMNGGHEDGAAVGLKNGSALFLAGGDWNGNIGRGAEVFDPNERAAIFGAPEIKIATWLARRHTVARVRMRVQNVGDIVADRVEICVNDYRYLFKSRFEQSEGFEHCRVDKKVPSGGWFSGSMTLTSKRPVKKGRVVDMSAIGSMKNSSDRFTIKVPVTLRKAPRSR